jgi:hypothetical protein
MNSLKEMLAAVKNQEQMPELIIDEEFKALLDETTPEERKSLKESIQQEGIREPLIVWDEQSILLDGHNRLAVAKELSLPYRTERKSFASREDAEKWIIRNQLGRRNLTKDRYNYFIGKLYLAAKGTGQQLQVAEQLAEEFGKASVSVRHDADFASGVDKLAAIRGKIEKDKVLSGKGELNKGDVEKIGKTKNLVHAKKLIEHIEKKKVSVRTQKAQAKASVEKLTVKYEAIFAFPDYNAENMVVWQNKKPPLAENAYLFLLSEDEDIYENLRLMAHWGFKYEGSYIMAHNNVFASVWAKIKHQQLLIGARGTVTGPAKGKEPESIIRTPDIYETAFKTVESFIPVGPEKRLDLTGSRPNWAHLEVKE